MPSFYEFFAGGGMARAGLGTSWNCLFANDFDRKKTDVYADNWGRSGLRTADVARLSTADIPGQADLTWASFPCQDLSLAGDGAGLRGKRSGTFWPFWKLIRNLKSEGRAPRLVVLENVCGALTSHGGRDFAAIGNSLADAGYAHKGKRFHYMLCNPPYGVDWKKYQDPIRDEAERLGTGGLVRVCRASPTVSCCSSST